MCLPHTARNRAKLPIQFFFFFGSIQPSRMSGGSTSAIKQQEQVRRRVEIPVQRDTESMGRAEDQTLSSPEWSLKPVAGWKELGKRSLDRCSCRMGPRKKNQAAGQ